VEGFLSACLAGLEAPCYTDGEVKIMDATKTGAFIAALRKEQGYTQTAFAEKLNISNRTVSKWENGDGYPDITMLPALAEALGVSTDELLLGERIPQAEEKQPVFTATFTEDTAGWKKGLSAWNSRRRPVYFSVALFLFAEALCMSGIIYFDAVGQYGLKAFVAVLAGLLAVFHGLVFLSVALYPKMQLRKIRQLNGGKVPPVRYTFYEDTLAVERGVGRHTFALGDISELRIAKDIYLIVVHKNVLFYIPKATLDGQNEAFEGFIKASAGTVSVAQTQKEHKVIAAMLTAAAAALLILNGLAVYNSNDSYFYRNLEAKTQYYYENAEELTHGVELIEAGRDTYGEELEADGVAYLNPADYALQLENIDCVDVTKSSLCFEPDGARFWCGYVYYEGNGMPAVSDLGFFNLKELDSAEPVFIEADNVYLFGKTKNGTLTSKPWYLLVPLENGWYYYELHNY